MPSSREKVKSRFFGFNPWNHKLRVGILLPVFYMIGYVLGIFAAAQFVPTSPIVVGAVSGGLGVLVGIIPLALID